MTRLAWPDLLDALEERNRRCEALLRGAAEEPGALPEVELVPDGPLPADLALRVRALLDDTQRLEQLLAVRTRRAEQALHYGRA